MPAGRDQRWERLRSSESEPRSAGSSGSMTNVSYSGGPNAQRRRRYAHRTSINGPTQRGVGLSREPGAGRQTWWPVASLTGGIAHYTCRHTFAPAARAQRFGTTSTITHDEDDRCRILVQLQRRSHIARNVLAPSPSFKEHSLRSMTRDHLAPAVREYQTAPACPAAGRRRGGAALGWADGCSSSTPLLGMRSARLGAARRNERLSLVSTTS